MSRARIALICVALSLVGCGSSITESGPPSASPLQDCRGSNGPFPPDPAQGPIHYASFTVSGKLRGYRIFKPSGLDYAKPIPLVVVLHGAPSNADQLNDLVHFDSEATAAGFLAVYPNACDGFWNAQPGSYDVDFISQLINRLEGQFLIDRARVFIIGVSTGGFMAYRLACEIAGQITAMASIAGSLLFDDCHPSRPLSILEMHGTLDANIPYDGGSVGLIDGTTDSPAVVEVIKEWTTLDGCVGGPLQSTSGITKTSLWNHCQGGVDVRLDTVVGGHHTWFGSSFDPVPGEPDANAAVWSFLGQL